MTQLIDQRLHVKLGAAAHERDLRLGNHDALDLRVHASAFCGSQFVFRFGILGSGSGGVTEVDDVAVLNDVFLAFEADFAVLLAHLHRSTVDQRVVGHDLGSDESALDVAVNLARGELRRRPAMDRPGTTLVLTDGEERHVPEQVVAWCG